MDVGGEEKGGEDRQAMSGRKGGFGYGCWGVGYLVFVIQICLCMYVYTLGPLSPSGICSLDKVSTVSTFDRGIRPSERHRL
jgi:hypothetical protein